MKKTQKLTRMLDAETRCAIKAACDKFFENSMAALAAARRQHIMGEQAPGEFTTTRAAPSAVPASAANEDRYETNN